MIKIPQTVEQIEAGAQPLTPEEAKIRDYVKAHPDEEKDGQDKAYELQGVDELRRELEEKGEINLVEIQGTPEMEAINRLLGMDGDRLDDKQRTKLVDAIKLQGIERIWETNTLTLEEFDALVRYCEKSYENPVNHIGDIPGVKEITKGLDTLFSDVDGQFIANWIREFLSSFWGNKQEK